MAVTTPIENLPIGDMSSSLPTETMLAGSSEQGKIGGSSVDAVFLGAQKYIEEVGNGKEKQRLIDQANEVSGQVTNSDLMKRIGDLESTNISADQQQADRLRTAIKATTLRPEKLKDLYHAHDLLQSKFDTLRINADNLSISPAVNSMVTEWDGFLYDSGKTKYVDRVRELSDLVKESSRAPGQAKTDIEINIGRIKNGTSTPEIVKLTLVMQDAFKTNGETFQEYLNLKRKSVELGKKDGKLEGKDLRTWDIDKAIVTNTFSGHEDLLAILTGDVFDEQYRKDNGINYTGSDLKVLRAIHDMVDMMAKAHDGKGLGKVGVERAEGEAMPQIVESTSELLQPQEEGLEPGVQRVLDSYMARMAKENRADWNLGEREKVIERAKILLAGNK